MKNKWIKNKENKNTKHMYDLLFEAEHSQFVFEDPQILHYDQ